MGYNFIFVFITIHSIINIEKRNCMDYRIWVFPILVMFLISGYYLGKKISILFSFHQSYLKIGYWGVIYTVLALTIIFRSYFIAWIIYTIIFYIIFDIVHFILKRTNQEHIFKKIYQKGVSVLVASLLMMIYGIYNANHPMVKTYNIDINHVLKKDIKIGMISDLHLGTIHGSKILDEVVGHANQLEIQLFILAGDIFDENTSEELKKKAYQTLSKIKTKYGVYYIEGNHDLLTEETKRGFEQHGIHVLSDEVSLIDQTFYLIGRKDKRRDDLNTPRKTLENLLAVTSKEYPIILVDHQPEDQKKAAKLGIDLQLSGHTHAGQIFPLNMFLQYGYYKKNNYQLIISSGYGVWGFSVRTAGRSEMVYIHVKGI